MSNTVFVWEISFAVSSLFLAAFVTLYSITFTLEKRKDMLRISENALRT